jgi:hypothetical protein
VQSHGLILDTITPHEHGLNVLNDHFPAVAYRLTPRAYLLVERSEAIERLERFERASQMSPSDETE